MPLYKGSTKIKELYIGDRKVKQLYADNKLVFLSPLPSGTVIFESATPGTYEINLPTTQNYEIWMVGGGGSGAMYSQKLKGICGSGAYVYGVTELQKGVYTITVGAKGPSLASAGGNTTAFGQIAGGGPKNMNDQATYTVSLPGLSGTLGNTGGIGSGGESLYEGYGRGGMFNADPYPTSGYIKIVAR